MTNETTATIAAVVSAVGATISSLIAGLTLLSARRERMRRDAANDRRQAEQILVWRGGQGAVISNASSLSVSHVVVGRGLATAQVGSDLSFIRDESYMRSTCILQVPPGDWTLAAPENPGAGIGGKLPGWTISFTDAMGTHWRRDVHGILKKTKHVPEVESGVTLPVFWEYDLKRYVR